MSAFTTKFSPLSTNTVISSAVISVFLCLSVPVFADVTYGPVQPKDTLGKIVNRFYVGSNRSSIALMKTIVANNPQAFIKGNMNRLKLNALLALPGNDWLVSEPRFVTPDKALLKKITKQASSGFDASILANRTVKQMQDRIIFLEGERLSLIAQVADLKQNEEKLINKIKRLEEENHASDDQLRVLDKEIIRLTELLGNKGSVVSQDAPAQLSVLQGKLLSVQQETEQLRNELSKAQTELSNDSYLKQETDQAIAQLSQENRQLQHLLQESQPGVHYFGEAPEGYQLSLFGGKLNVPLWVLILGGALTSLVVITLLATRRKNKNTSLPTEPDALQQTATVDTYDSLLETTDHDVDMESRFIEELDKPEENVFKMFDEGTLEMDLKLDMAEAYLEVSDFDSAKSVLQEVIDGGSELQQRKAARLMKQAA